MVNPLFYEVLALILAAIFGADFALTEASLSALLKDVEKMHAEFNERAQANYEKVQDEVSSIESRVSKEKQAMEARLIEVRESLSKLHIGSLSFNQRRILQSISRFTPEKKWTLAQNKDRLLLTGTLKKELEKALFSNKD